jgi:hypothetical protein
MLLTNNLWNKMVVIKQKLLGPSSSKITEIYTDAAMFDKNKYQTHLKLG